MGPHQDHCHCSQKLPVKFLYGIVFNQKIMVAVLHGFYCVNIRWSVDALSRDGVGECSNEHVEHTLLTCPESGQLGLKNTPPAFKSMSCLIVIGLEVHLFVHASRKSFSCNFVIIFLL